jgi:ferredoxin
MGALLDFTRRFFVRVFAVPRAVSWEGRRLKYYLLAAILTASAAGWQAAWFLDPFSIIARGFSVTVIPLFNFATTSFFDSVYYNLPFLRPVSEPVFTLLKEHVLTFEQQVFRWAWLPLLLLGTVMLLEYWQPRFWCRNLCPLGGLLSLCARGRALTRRVSDDCVDCGECYGTCPIGLLEDGTHRGSQAECHACMLCPPVCPEEAIGFDWGYRRPEAALDLSRRRLIGSAAAGLALVPLTRVHPLRAMAPPARLRPPGAHAEAEFLNRCLRCGACMKVCMRNAIHPALHEAGWEGLLTPVMDFEIGYCEYNCTLCGQVCPSEAIRRIPLPEKQKYVIGMAFIDKDRCIPYRRWENCIVCEEHCPVPEKAIVFEEVESVSPAGEKVLLKRPVVLKDKCIGCGICQEKCPVEAPAAIVITPHLETRARTADPYGYG